MFKETFGKVVDDFETRFGIAIKLGLDVYPSNNAFPMRQIASLIVKQLPHCEMVNNPNRMLPVNVPGEEITMDRLCGSRRGYGVQSLREELDFYVWRVITVAVYPGMTQILFDEGPVMDHYTYGCKVVDNFWVRPSKCSVGSISNWTY